MTPPVVTSVLPNSLLQTLEFQVTVTPAPSVFNPAELGSLVNHALTSGGVPSEAASALITVVIDSAATPTMVSTDLPSKAAAAATISATKQKQLNQAQISALIQRLLRLFHLA
ncbi:MAG: hypothetical protein LQ351_005643 [Letrouitia transgressa]|nr:MAG: hypothetical protein LQ351_005643 [Letrouitia transgressa]